ncbi:WD40-repeat-containing domain protein [Radiomyces spectabilis]|uniref:WD40-repeat-containing domain protein n=1 Tax=Radiomyces spectabilis TaxID=64574 RepID=UPI00221E56BC|nr:WD40-repeat-containing domain protein [Radiomyces spectabilis]KAI8369421.1 WD40-repeat-containing domain protein [Radiomyces spectabilis]
MASDTLAVVLKNEIQEIDLNKVQRYGAPLVRALSISSLSPSQDTHPDSYPDSEEDDGDAMSSDTEIETGMKKYARRRGGTAKHSSTSTPTSGLPPSATRSHPDEPSKPSQNLGLDHLQDTLKRSLGMGKAFSKRELIDKYSYLFSSDYSSCIYIYLKKKQGSDHARSPIGTSPGGSSMDSGDRERMILLRRPIVATCAETHPQFPFYITGGDPSTGGASAMLWQFGQEREIATYYGCQDKTTKIHFDRFGQKFGAADMHGNLCLWRFDSHAHSDKPYCTLSCHSKATRDFAFLGSSSVIATAGTSTTMSRRRDNVCIWDTLLPPHKAMVCALPAHESGAYAIAYDPNRHLLFSGGKRGDIVVSDIRQRSTMHTFTAHHARIRSIAVDLSNQAVISGSIDGELKIWDASTYRLRQTFDIQPRNRFLTSSFKHIPLKAFGVTQVQMMDDGYVYTSGPAGVLRCRSSMHDHL